MSNTFHGGHEQTQLTESVLESTQHNGIGSKLVMTIKAKNYANAYFDILKDATSLSLTHACAFGISCPGKAGERQKLSMTVEPATFDWGEYTVQLQLRSGVTNVDDMLYCVEFPVKVI